MATVLSDLITVVVNPTVNQVNLLPKGNYTFVQTGFNNYETLSATSNQTIFQLSSAPLQPAQSLLFINGVKANFGTQFNIDGSVLNWLDSFIALDPADVIEYYYN